MATNIDELSSGLRAAVKDRLDATPADDPKMAGYKSSCCDGGKCQPKMLSSVEMARRLGSSAFHEILEEIRAMHVSKSHDYGSSNDPLANIRNGAEFVGIEPWRAAMVRLSDKVTRLATFNRTGTLKHEGVEDSLLDLASYACICLLLYREGKRGGA